MLRLVSLLVLVAGCVNPFTPPRDTSPLVVTATDGTASAAPVFSWTSAEATSLSVYDAEGRTVWGLVSGYRTLSDGRVERVEIASPVRYGAFADEADGRPGTATPAAPLRPGTYRVTVTHVGGGSGGFTGRRPTVRTGETTFTIR